MSCKQHEYLHAMTPNEIPRVTDEELKQWTNPATRPHGNWGQMRSKAAEYARILLEARRVLKEADRRIGKLESLMPSNDDHWEFRLQTHAFRGEIAALLAEDTKEEG